MKWGMMARQPNPDLTNTLTMLHTSVIHADKNIRDALDKSVEKLESASRAAHDQTTKEVVDELSRMRSNFRDVHNKLNTNTEALNTAVQDVVTQLRTELQEVRGLLGDLTPPPLSPAPVPEIQETPATQNGHTGLAPAPATTVSEPYGPPREATGDAVIPAQPTAAEDSAPGPVLSVDAVCEAVREVLNQELAPVLALLTAPDRTAVAPAGDQDVPDPLRESAAEIKEEVSTALEEARSTIASLRQEIAGLRTAVEELRPQPGDTAPIAEVRQEHSALLKTAARVSSAGLLCHRDIWEFITAHAGQHPHFRVPPQVAPEHDERIRAALSGRSLIALLISLYSVKHTAADGDGDRELAATLYERIEESLTGLTPAGEPVTITLDDRATPAPSTPHAEGGAEADDEPDTTSTSGPEEDTGPGEEAGPAAA